jgi:hypothetical protein
MTSNATLSADERRVACTDAAPSCMSAVPIALMIKNDQNMDFLSGWLKQKKTPETYVVCGVS